MSRQCGGSGQRDNARDALAAEVSSELCRVHPDCVADRAVDDGFANDEAVARAGCRVGVGRRCSETDDKDAILGAVAQLAPFTVGSTKASAVVMRALTPSGAVAVPEPEPAS